MNQKIKQFLYELKILLVVVIKVVFYFFIIPIIVIAIITLPFFCLYDSKLIYSFVSDTKISNSNVIYNIKKYNYCSKNTNCYFIGYCLKLYDSDECSNDEITILLDNFKLIENIYTKDNIIYFNAINSDNVNVNVFCRDYEIYSNANAEIKCKYQ